VSDADRSRAFAALGEATDLAGAVDDARSRYHEAVRLDPANTHAWQRLGWNLIASAMRSGNSSLLLEAREAFTRAIDGATEGTLQAGDEADLLIGRGIATASCGDHDAAESDYRAAIALGVNHAPAYKALGDLSLHRQNAQEAIDAYTEHIELLPTHGRVPGPLEFGGPLPSTNLAHTLLQRAGALSLGGRPRDALADLDHAERLVDVDTPTGHALGSAIECSRGVAHLGLGDPHASIAATGRALERDHDNAQAYMVRAAAHRLLGDENRAMEDEGLARGIAERAMQAKKK
jgi:tetratricopeptide (TPR) repeat protein